MNRDTELVVIKERTTHTHLHCLVHTRTVFDPRAVPCTMQFITLSTPPTVQMDYQQEEVDRAFNHLGR